MSYLSEQVLLNLGYPTKELFRKEEEWIGRAVLETILKSRKTEKLNSPYNSTREIMFLRYGVWANAFTWTRRGWENGGKRISSGGGFLINCK